MAGTSGGRGARYRIPAGEAQGEIVVKNSLFVGSVGHAPSAEKAHGFIARVKRAFPDASHNAWAFRIFGGPQAVIGSSDDGEPGGTAGRPMLAVLEGSGLCEIVVVGTRYFGGVKLGAGGLARAYASAAREALAELTTVERVLHRVARVEVHYGWYDRLRHSLARYKVKVEDQQFANTITMELAIPYGQVEQVTDVLRHVSSGQVDLDSNCLEARYI